MNLGDVATKTVPKMSLISAALKGGVLNTRTFIPHRVHESIGVLGSVSIATACMLPGTLAQEYLRKPVVGPLQQLEIEHPSGSFKVEIEVDTEADTETKSATTDGVVVKRAALLRTARLLMRGEVYVPANAIGSKT